jgi:prepilin-type N-terminal cleavage/methylation domain-containing protein
MAPPAATATPRTSRTETRISKRGFTLIELTVVITILVLFAVAVAPNVLNQQRSGETRAFYSAARRIVSTARETAISTKSPVFLTFDDSQRRLVLSQDDAQTEQKSEIEHVSLPDGINAGAFRVGGVDSNSSDWSIGFYPDGTADAGGLELELGDGQRSLMIAANGSATLSDGEMPDTTADRWPAGSYEQRL